MREWEEEVRKERKKKEIMPNDDINEFNYINGRGSLISGFLLFGVFFLYVWRGGLNYIRESGA